MNERACRFCGAYLNTSFVDLGMSPLANRYLQEAQLSQMEPFYPLHAYVCERCLLVQIENCESPEVLFGDYSYFSSFSDTWLEHAKTFAEFAERRFGLNRRTQVIEVASNDGYLLQYFIQKGIPALGIEPAANVAEIAIRKGIPTTVEFFGKQSARRLCAKGKLGDLIIGNNVLAHAPGLNDFVEGLRILLKPNGVITLEFPHLMRLIHWLPETEMLVCY